jgi:hypothetical protein
MRVAKNTPNNLKAVIGEFTDDEIPLFVECDADGVVELAVAAEGWQDVSMTKQTESKSL